MMITRGNKKILWLILGLILVVHVFLWAPPTLARVVPAIPRITVGVDAAENPEDVALSLQILVLLTILSLAPAILVMMTSFTRIVVVHELPHWYCRLDQGIRLS